MDKIPLEQEIIGRKFKKGDKEDVIKDTFIKEYWSNELKLFIPTIRVIGKTSPHSYDLSEIKIINS